MCVSIQRSFYRKLEIVLGSLKIKIKIKIIKIIKGVAIGSEVVRSASPSVESRS